MDDKIGLPEYVSKYLDLGPSPLIDVVITKLEETDLGLIDSWLDFSEIFPTSRLTVYKKLIHTRPDLLGYDFDPLLTEDEIYALYGVPDDDDLHMLGTFAGMSEDGVGGYLFYLRSLEIEIADNAVDILIASYNALSADSILNNLKGDKPLIGVGIYDEYEYNIGNDHVHLEIAVEIATYKYTSRLDHDTVCVISYTYNNAYLSLDIQTQLYNLMTSSDAPKSCYISNGMLEFDSVDVTLFDYDTEDDLKLKMLKFELLNDEDLWYSTIVLTYPIEHFMRGG